MSGGRVRISDERGLIGKIAVVWLLLGALLVVAAIDTAQILYARYKAEAAAESAAFDAAVAWRSSPGDRNAAYEAAVGSVERSDPSAKLTAFTLDPSTGEVTVTVVRRAPTLVVGHLGFLRHLTKAKATQTAQPPTL